MPNSVNYKTFSSTEEFKKILEVQNVKIFFYKIYDFHDKREK